MIEPVPFPSILVLVVEDEPLIRMIASDVLAEAGFEVEEASDAHDALQRLETRTDVRIVFSDVDMPGRIDGVALAATIRQRWPKIDVVLTSGNIRTPLSALPERCLFVAKPYDLKVLVQTLKDLAIQQF